MAQGGSGDPKSYTLEEMQEQFYQGYPEWRQSDYAQQAEILEKVIH